MLNDGGSAFPVIVTDYNEHTHEYENTHSVGGKSLRDEFAGQALMGYASNKRIMDNAIDGWQNSGGERPTCVAEYLAGLAYEVADAMLEARKSK